MEKGFWSAFGISVVVLGGIMAATVAMVQPGMNVPADASSYGSTYAYHPVAEDNLTAVVLGLEENGKPGECMLIRLIPEKGQVPLTVLPMSTLLSINDTQNQLKDIYREHGAEGVKKALAGTLQVPVDRYVVINEEAFYTVTSKTGTVTVTLDEEVSYNAEERTIQYSAGVHKLDGHGIAELLAAPVSSENLTKRSNDVGKLAADYINQNLDAASEGRSERLFTQAVNVVSTDITFTDFALRAKALHFMSKLEGVQVAGVVPLEGEMNEQGFRLSEAYIKQVGNFFR